MSRQGSKSNGGAVNTRSTNTRPSGSGGQRRGGGGGGRGSGAAGAPSKRPQANGRNEATDSAQATVEDTGSQPGAENLKAAGGAWGSGTSFKDIVKKNVNGGDNGKGAEGGKGTDKPKKPEDESAIAAADNAGIQFGDFATDSDPIAGEKKAEATAPVPRHEKLRSERGLQRTTSCPPAPSGEGLKSPAHIPDKVITTTARPHEASNLGKTQEPSNLGKTTATSNLGRSQLHEPSNLGKAVSGEPASASRNQPHEQTNASQSQAPQGGHIARGIAQEANPLGRVQAPETVAALKPVEPALASRSQELGHAPKPQENSSKLPEGIPVAVPVPTERVKAAEPYVKPPEPPPVSKPAAAPPALPSVPHSLQHGSQFGPPPPHVAAVVEQPLHQAPVLAAQAQLPQQHGPLHVAPHPHVPPPSQQPHHHGPYSQFGAHRGDRPAERVERPERAERTERPDRPDRPQGFHPSQQHQHKGGQHQYGNRQSHFQPQQAYSAQPFRPAAYATASPGYVGQYGVPEYANVTSVPHSVPGATGGYYTGYGTYPQAFYQQGYPQMMPGTNHPYQYAVAPPAAVPAPPYSSRSQGGPPPQGGQRKQLKIVNPNTGELVAVATPDPGRTHDVPAPPAPARQPNKNLRIEPPPKPPGDAPAPPPKPLGDIKHPPPPPPAEPSGLKPNRAGPQTSSEAVKGLRATAGVAVEPSTKTSTSDLPKQSANTQAKETTGVVSLPSHEGSADKQSTSGIPEPASSKPNTEKRVDPVQESSSVPPALAANIVAETPVVVEPNVPSQVPAEVSATSSVPAAPLPAPATAAPTPSVSAAVVPEHGTTSAPATQEVQQPAGVSVAPKVVVSHPPPPAVPEPLSVPEEKEATAVSTAASTNVSAVSNAPTVASSAEPAAELLSVDVVPPSTLAPAVEAAGVEVVHKEPQSFALDLADEESETGDVQDKAFPPVVVKQAESSLPSEGLASSTAAPEVSQSSASTETCAATLTSDAPTPAAEESREDISEDARDMEEKTGPDGEGDGNSSQPATSKKSKNKRKEALKRAENEPGKGDMLAAFRIQSKQDEPEQPVVLGSSPFAEVAKGPLAAAKQEKDDSEDVSDNWESAVEEEPTKAQTRVLDIPSGRKVYSRDFMLTLQRSCTEFPPGFDSVPQELASDGPPRFDTFESGRMTRSRSGQLRGQQDDGQWGRRNAGAMDPRYNAAQGRGAGPQMGRGPSGQLGRPTNVDSDKWQQRGPPPPPSPSARGYSMTRSGSASGNMPALHKTENKYVAGKTITDDPDEEKKQRQFKAILNKLTVDNFERLSEQILDVGIEQQKTLVGLIDQIFDKALIETNFCEMYASLCQCIHPRLPSFEDPSLPNGKRMDFRRLLLNKCQEEFEKGTAAMRAVEAREAKERDEKELAEVAAKKEEGELDDSDKATKEAEKQTADAERAARRRMLGNIQFIGHLYRFKLLTEKIMHNCIISLLSEEKNPKAEDVECLCKLMSTVGKQLDSSQKTEHKSAMDVYFNRMERLRQHNQLDARIRFMVQDVHDLRSRKWVPRVAKEGPKKIEDVHKEAAAQLEAQAQRDRDERRKGPPGRMDQYGMRGSYGNLQDSRVDQRQDNRSRLLAKDEYQTAISGNLPKPQRQGSQEIDLRPQGQGYKMKMPSARPESTISKPASQVPTQVAVQAPEPVQPPPPVPGRATPSMGTKESHSATKNFIEELFASSQADSIAALKDLSDRGADMAVVVQYSIVEALEHRGVEYEKRLAPLQAVLLAALDGDQPVLTKEDLESGVHEYIVYLSERIEDTPKAPGVVSVFLADFIAEGLLPLGPVCNALLEGTPMDEGGDPPLVEAGAAAEFTIKMLSKLKDTKTEAEAAAMWEEAGLDISKFVSDPEREDPALLKEMLEKKAVAFLLKE